MKNLKQSRWYIWPQNALIALSSITVLFMMTITGVDVVGRYFLNRPISGVFELTEFSMAISVFSVLPLVCLRRRHVTADLLIDVWSSKGQTVQRMFSDLCGLVLFGLLTWRLWLEAGVITKYGTTAGVLELPLGSLTYFAAFLSGICTLVFAYLLTGLPTTPTIKSGE